MHGRKENTQRTSRLVNGGIAPPFPSHKVSGKLSLMLSQLVDQDGWQQTLLAPERAMHA